MGVILRSAICIAVITAISPLNDTTDAPHAPAAKTVQANIAQKLPEAAAAGQAMAGHMLTLCTKNTDMCRAAIAHWPAAAEPGATKPSAKRPGA